MPSHKRRRPKHQRAGCIFCKPHKDERGSTPDRPSVQRRLQDEPQTPGLATAALAADRREEDICDGSCDHCRETGRILDAIHEIPDSHSEPGFRNAPRRAAR